MNGGSAASGKESSSSEDQGAAPAPAGTDVPQQRTERQELTGEQVAVVKAIAASLPAALVELLPYRTVPKRNRSQFLAAMGGRTTAQIIDRAARRWVQHGYAEALHSIDGKGIGSAVGVAVALVQAGECTHPRCEDGFNIDTGEECRVCETRRADRRAAKKAAAEAGRNTGTVRQAPHRPGWWECTICHAPGKGDIPESGECRRCQDETAAAAQQLAAQWEQEAAERQKTEEAALLAIEEAAARRQAEDQRAAKEHTARRQAADEETVRLRAELAAQYPELAAVSGSTSTAPF
ncbi:hypothetical protein [Streptomyces anulatus]|uniref:hypothetical protein n=1 Tax=Streptomyces anulatus TaxID=1892 RepID=UPI002F91AE33